MFYLFCVLLSSHFIGDFALQTKKLADSKTVNPVFLLIHSLIHLFTCLVLVLLMEIDYNLILLAGFFLSHLIIDYIKVKLTSRNYSPSLLFTIDQLSHFFVLLVISYFWFLWGAEVTMENIVIPVIITGVLGITHFARILLDIFSIEFADQELDTDGCPLRRLTEMLERLMIFVSIILGFPLVMGFLLVSRVFIIVNSENRLLQQIEYRFSRIILNYFTTLIFAVFCRLSLDRIFSLDQLLNFI